MRIVILGVGNILLTDEGVGPYTVDRLMERYEFPEGVHLIDGGTSAMELLDDMAHADLLLIVDAVRSGRAPGSVVVLEGEDVPKFFTTKLSPHQVGLCDVLASLSLTEEDPKETVIVGVEPESLAMHLGLSDPVSAAVPEVIDTVLARLAARGVKPAARAPAAS